MPIEGGSHNFLTVDEYFAIKRDNQVAAKARFIAMGMLNIRGRVHSVDEGHIELAGEDQEWPRVECVFSRRPDHRGLLSSATPSEVITFTKVTWSPCGAGTRLTKCGLT